MLLGKKSQKVRKMNFYGAWSTAKNALPLNIAIFLLMLIGTGKAINDDGVDDLCTYCRCNGPLLDCSSFDLSGVVEKISTKKSSRKTKIARFAATTGFNLSAWLSCGKLSTLDVLDLRQTEFDCAEVYKSVKNCSGELKVGSAPLSLSLKTTFYRYAYTVTTLRMQLMRRGKQRSLRPRPPAQAP